VSRSSMSDPEYRVRIKNWSKYQKGNTSKFIALQTKMLHDPTMFELTIGQRWLWVALLLHAGCYGVEFTLRASYARVAFGLRAGWKHVEDMNALQNNGLIEINGPRREEREEKEEKRERKIPPPKTAADPVEYPDGLNVIAWRRYEAHRKDIRARKLTPTGKQQAMNRWAKCSDVAQVKAVDETVSNGWTGCFPEKHEPSKGKPSYAEQLARDLEVMESQNGSTN